jgi:hypothetical protein
LVFENYEEELCKKISEIIKGKYPSIETKMKYCYLVTKVNNEKEEINLPN